MMKATPDKPTAAIMLSGERLTSLPEDQDQTKDAPSHHSCSTQCWDSSPEHGVKGETRHPNQ